MRADSGPTYYVVPTCSGLSFPPWETGGVVSTVVGADESCVAGVRQVFFFLHFLSFVYASLCRVSYVRGLVSLWIFFVTG